LGGYRSGKGGVRRCTSFTVVARPRWFERGMLREWGVCAGDIAGVWCWERECVSGMVGDVGVGCVRLSAPAYLGAARWGTLLDSSVRGSCIP
jgi:hypothetical protein